MRTSTTCLAWLILAINVSGGELLEPVPILVGGKPLDVEQMGHAAPFVADFDGDGVKDLLIGEFSKGRLRIYRNVGTNNDSQFERFTLFQNGDRSGCIHASCCMGFGPQMVDLDGDGHNDIISGNWIHQVILFRGLGDGLYAAGEPIRDGEGRPIAIGYGVSAFAADWDDDGDLDLVAGTVEHTDHGNVYLIRNEGSSSKYQFEKPERLSPGGAPIVAKDGGAAPVIADWDGDGRQDLILGCGDGSVRWYRNIGSRQSPELARYVQLAEAPSEGSDRGRSAKICVTDWNEDGLLDLLLGDAGARFEKQLSGEEKQWRHEARTRQADFLREWAQLFAGYRRAALEKAESDSGLHEQRLAAMREELARLSSVRSRYHAQEAALKSGTQIHGRVWLFLRRGTSAEPVASN